MNRDLRAKDICFFLTHDVYIERIRWLGYVQNNARDNGNNEKARTTKKKMVGRRGKLKLDPDIYIYDI